MRLSSRTARGGPAGTEPAAPGRAAADRTGGTGGTGGTEPTAATALRLSRATIGYRGRPVVFDADLAVAAGEAVALLGPNGSGKTTVVRGVVGLAEVLAGRVELLGRAVTPGRRGARARVGYVPQRQGAGGAVTSTAREVVEVGLLARRGVWRRPGRTDRATVTAALAEVGLDDLARVPVGELSGGQQRRLLIARALVAEPDVLLLDEPTAGVDRAGVDALVATLTAVKAGGRALVVVSHDLAELGGVPDRAVTISHGRLVGDEVLARRPAPPPAALAAAGGPGGS